MTDTNETDYDAKQLQDLSGDALERFAEEYGVEGLMNDSEERGFKTGYGYRLAETKSALAERDARIEELEGLIKKLPINSLGAKEHEAIYSTPPLVKIRATLQNKHK